MSFVNVASWLEDKFPFTINNLAASLALDIGFTSAIPLSQDGKEVEGKKALLVNIMGRVRKLTIATSESMLRTPRASAVR